MKSIDLKNEAINDIKVGDRIDNNEKNTMKKNYHEVTEMGFPILVTSDYDDSLRFKNLFLAFKNNKIVSIATDNKNFTTGRGIKVGDALSQVKVQYGANFFTEEGEIGTLIGYIDRKNHITLNFFYHENKVQQIVLTLNKN